MNDEHKQVSDTKVSLEQRMTKRPQVLARFHSIADMMDQAVAAGCTADEAEERAIEQVRQLGRELMGDWAQEQQDDSLARARSQHPQAIKHIKKK
jgi:L-serine deaminase